MLLCAAMTISSVTVLATGDVSDPPESGQEADSGVPDGELPGQDNGQAEGGEVPEEGALPNGQTDENQDTGEGGQEAPPPEDPSLAEDPNLIKVILNDQRLSFPVDPVVLEGNTFVPLRAFCEAMGCQVVWSPTGKTTVTLGEELKMEVQTGSDLVSANDRFFYMPAPAQMVNGSLMVPIRGLAKVFTLDVAWDGPTHTVTLLGGQVLACAADFYNEDDLLWLSRIIHAESRGEPLEGKIAVGNVVINRTKSGSFPDTIYDVIFDKKNGTQFTPTKSGTVYNTPTEECVLAAKLCLEGHTAVDDALYFLSTKSAKGWIAKNRTLVAKIGNHNFFA